jgi:hypothetical protein
LDTPFRLTPMYNLCSKNSTRLRAVSYFLTAVLYLFYRKRYIFAPF